MLKKDNSDYVKTPAFYYIGHFSKFVKTGARRIAYSKYSSDIIMTSFKNPDGSVAIIMLNKTNYKINFSICMKNIMFKDSLEANSIVTYLI